MHFGRIDTPFKIVYALAGFDPTNGAGVGLDAAVIRSAQCSPVSVITCSTVQNTLGVRALLPMEAAFFRAQLDAVATDLPPDAIKVGAIGSPEILHEICRFLDVVDVPVVVDPVLASSEDFAFGVEPEDYAPLIERATLLTPNLHEAALLTGIHVRDHNALDEAGWALLELGPKAVLIKGGHLAGDATDILFDDDGQHVLPGVRIEGGEVHGTGCALSSLLASYLAQGEALADAVKFAKSVVSRWIEDAVYPGSGKGLIRP